MQQPGHSNIFVLLDHGLLYHRPGPPHHTRLLGTSSIAASPFMIAMEDAGIKELQDLLNVVVMVGLCAIRAESLYISSVSTAMARMGSSPANFGRIGKQGRPYMLFLSPWYYQQSSLTSTAPIPKLSSPPGSAPYQRLFTSS